MLMSANAPLSELENTQEFIARHIGLSAADEAHMLAAIGQSSRRALIEAVVPRSIARRTHMAIEPGTAEAQALAELKVLAQRNQVFKSHIGQGYPGTHTPPVIPHIILENPYWYTGHHQYQDLISQRHMT